MTDEKCSDEFVRFTIPLSLKNMLCLRKHKILIVDWLDIVAITDLNEQNKIELDVKEFQEWIYKTLDPDEITICEKQLFKQL